MSLIQLQQISRCYRMGGETVHALRDVSLDIQRGEYVAIMGPSGSGKSTLMNLIGCLDTPTTGHYVLNGIRVSEMGDNQLAEIRNREIGFVFQTFNLLPRLSVYQNVMLPMIYAGKTPGERRKRVEEVLEMVQLSNRRQHHPGKLSGGEQQRAAIARAMVNNPRLILADEPTGNLDSENGLNIMRQLSRLNEEGRTIILITHDPDISAFARTHYRMKDGVLSGEPHVA